MFRLEGKKAVVLGVANDQSIVFAPRDDLHGRVIDASPTGFGQGGTCMTVSFLGASRVIEYYNIMGPVKAALEASVRYAASELGAKGIPVHALSPGPLRTRAASGLSDFDALLDDAAARAPTHHLATIEDVGAYAAFLASPEAFNVTGGNHLIDGGYSIVGQRRGSCFPMHRRPRLNLAPKWLISRPV